MSAQAIVVMRKPTNPTNPYSISGLFVPPEEQPTEINILFGMFDRVVTPDGPGEVMGGLVDKQGEVTYLVKVMDSPGGQPFTKAYCQEELTQQ